MKKAFRTVQFLANISLIVIAILLSLITFKQFTTSDTRNEIAQDRRIPATASAPSSAPGDRPERIVPIGKPIPIEGMDSDEKPALIMYLSTTCRYCTESAPFYKKVIEANASGNTKIVAVFPQPVEESREYLANLGIKIDDVRQSSALGAIGVRATPTVLLANKDMLVTDHWVGKLQPDREEQVLAKLGK